MDGKRGQHCPLQPVACSTHPRAWGACITAPTSLHTHSVPRGVGICSHLGFGSEFRHGCRAKATPGEQPKAVLGMQGRVPWDPQAWSSPGRGVLQGFAAAQCLVLLFGFELQLWFVFFFPSKCCCLVAALLPCTGTNKHACRQTCTHMCLCVLRAARPVFDAHHPGQQHSPHHPLHCSPLLCIEAAGADARRLSMVWASCQPQLGAVTREP